MAQQDIPTPRQLAFAQSLAARLGEEPSGTTSQSRKRLAAWIATKRDAQKTTERPIAATPTCDDQVMRKRAMEKAVEALLGCDPNDREELMIAGLRRGWGDDPVDTFLEEELQQDADWWATSVSPLVLTSYLKAILGVLDGARVGRTTRKILRCLIIDQ